MKASLSSAPRVTILIASWNGWSKLRTCLTSIYASDLPATIKVIVVDNGSTDGTQDHIRQEFPQVELRENATNRGHTAAINQGFALADGDYVAVLDDDTELAPDCLRYLLDFSAAHPEVGVVGPRMFNSDGTVQESARNFPSALNGLFGRRSLLTRLFPNNRVARRYLVREFLETDEPFACAQVSGACMFLRREVLDAVGLWDQRYIGYWVDTDWCQSIRQSGRGIYCVPAARLIHHESNARGKRKSAHRTWIFHRGAYQYFTRWHCRGYWDPRSLLAGTLLTTRAALLIALNAMRREPAIAQKPTASEPAFAPEAARPELRGVEP
jgi:N-acetylglucosaminyl-diphospho-decaprenol L-rhamnosyltransferase